MTRYFNTHGPVNEEEHYVVSRQALVAELAAQIAEGHYFTIYAPRQMGKTTLLRRLAATLRAHPAMLPLVLSFEAFEAWPLSDFLQGFALDLGRALQTALQERNEPAVDTIRQIFTATLPTSFFALRELFVQLHEALPNQQLVLIIDEFDSTPHSALSPLLQMWRQIYLTGAARSLHSVVLVGLQNIATLNLGRSSPFNIARQVELSSFTVAEVADLLNQYTTETGQPFTANAQATLYTETEGHPFLVNRLAAILTEEMALNRTQPITEAELIIARDRLIEESNYNFEALLRRANEHRTELINMLFGGIYPFNRNDPLVRTLQMDGIIARNAEGNCRIANPIYGRVLLAAFRSPQFNVQGAMLVNGYDFRTHIVNGELQMGLLLTRFRQFIERRGREAFKITPMPQEATGQYLLMAYLDNAVRQVGGDLFTEIDSGNGRLDLIVTHHGRRYIVETKVWHGPKKFDEGLEQLESYLEQEGERVGYYVVFHARPRVYGKLSYPELEFTLQRPKATIYVYLVRLGPLFDENEDDSTSETSATATDEETNILA